jgi:hypothetical protein
MELSKIVGSMAVAIGVVVAAGHAVGEEEKNLQGAPAPQKTTVQKRIEDREAQRRQEMAEQQRRKEEFSRRCNSSALKSEQEAQFCRVAYRKL